MTEPYRPAAGRSRARGVSLRRSLAVGTLALSAAPDGARAAGGADAPSDDLVDLATVEHGSSIIEASSEYDQGTWSVVNLLDGRPERGWSGRDPEATLVIGLAHPTIQAIGIDTREAEEGSYPGISAARVEVERATDLSTFPDVTWEPVGVIELEPQTVELLATPGLYAPMLRFHIVNGGASSFVEVMEIMAFGEPTDTTTALDVIQLADSLAPEQPNAALFDDWAFAALPDGTVAACASDGTTATLASASGALRGTAIAEDGTSSELVLSALGGTVTAILDPGGTPRVGWGALDPAGQLSCGPLAPAGDVVVPSTVPATAREVEPLLVVAAARGDLVEVTAQLAAGSDPNVGRKDDGWTALLFAAQDGYTDVAQHLIDAGADVDLGTDEGWTALMIASQNGHEDTVATLLDAGADPRVGRASNWTALHAAALRGHASIAGRLIAAGAPLEAAEDGFTPLAIAAQEGGDAVVSFLIDGGANLDGAAFAGPTPLYMSAQNGHATTAQLLAAAGASVDDGGTEPPPIVIAAVGGHDGVIEVLAAAGADVNLPRDDGNTALHLAADNDAAATAALLLDLGADPTLTNDDGDTPLDVAIRRDADAVAAILRGD